MIIDPRYLMQIAAIVECGSFSAAAERLGTSQPGLSRTVSIVEKRTGQLLFDRNNRPPTPTEACRALADQGRAIRLASEHAVEAIARISKGEFGRIRIGAPPFLCDHLLSGVIAEFISRQPGIRIELIPDFIGGLQERLLADQIDIIVVAITIIDRTLPFKIERLMEDNNVIVCRAGHPLAHKKQIRNSDLEDALWISHSSTSTLHADMQAALTAAGVNRLKYSFESPSAGAVLKVLLSTDCLTMLPSNAASQLASKGQLRILPFAHASPSRPIGMITNAGREPTAAQKRMVAFLRERLNPDAPKTTQQRQGTTGLQRKAQR
jgi:DNA-binding transcriptional LysR family regulator